MEQRRDSRGNRARFRASLAKRKEIRRDIAALDKEIFKYETLYLEMTQGSSLLKNVEYYVSNRTDKKKHAVDDKARIFSSGFPGSEK